jgi:PadR family transcriptional regulator PadR
MATRRGAARESCGSVELDFHKRLRGSCPKRFMGITPDKSADLLQGTLELLILRTLATGEKHGYEIAEWIHVASAEALSVEEGALYPALHRLELRGLLTSQWDVSAKNRRAKYYRLTAAGRKRLKEATDSWRRTSEAINRVLEPI